MPAPKNDTVAIKQTIQALLKAGYKLSKVYDGEEDIPVTTETEATEAITAVDDATLWIGEGVGFLSAGWIRFVMGNDPDEVICDYTTNLDPVITPLMNEWWKP